MIRALILIVLLIANSYATNITGAKIEQNGEQITLVLQLDSIFSGSVEEKEEKSQSFLHLYGLTLESPYIFTPKTDLLASIRIHPNGSNTQIHIAQKKALDISHEIKASEIRVYFEAKQLIKDEKKIELGALHRLGENRLDIGQNYLFMGLFVAVILFMWILVKLFSKDSSSSWLLGKTKPDVIEVIQQKVLDSKNKIVQIRFKGMNYLLMIGNSNLVIDYYEENGTKSQNPFDNILSQTNAKLSDYLLEDDFLSSTKKKIK